MPPADDHWMAFANGIAGQSRDPNRKVGAVVVKNGQGFGAGCNGFVQRALETPERWDEKHKWVVHAEEHALWAAGAHAIGSTLYVNYFPCSRCANLIALAGVDHLVAPEPDFSHHRWGEEWKRALVILETCGVGVRHHELRHAA